MESLRRTGMSCGNNTLIHYENLSENKDESILSQLMANENEFTQLSNINVDSETLSNHSIIQTVIFQQKLLQKLQEEPSICQCMKQLLNSVISKNALDTKPDQVSTKPENIKSGNATMTQSCPECCKPIYSLATSLGLSNVFNNTKSWSLDSAKVLEIEKVILDSFNKMKLIDLLSALVQ